MRIIGCLKKMGFSDEEAQLIMDDVGAGEAKAMVAQHIAALEQERASIMDQVAEQAGLSQRAPTDAKLQSPEVENPSMQIPDENGNLVLASNAMLEATENVTKATEIAPGFKAAAECAMRFGT